MAIRIRILSSFSLLRYSYYVCYIGGILEDHLASDLDVKDANWRKIIARRELQVSSVYVSV